MLHKIPISLVALFLSIITLTAAEEKLQAPYFHITNSESSLDSLPLKSSKAKVSISGNIAEVELRQTYANTGGIPIEAIYIFPGSTGSAMHGMEMKIGERNIVAKIKERQQAKAAYEKAKSENKTASLLEQQRPNVFQMNVANILPGDEIEVLLRYSEHITATEGLYEFVMPTVVGPRYGNKTNHSEWTENPHLAASKNPATSFEFSMDLQTGLPLKQIFCTTHNSPVQYLSKQRAQLNIHSDKDATAMNRDIIVQYQLADEQIASGLLLHKGEEENFFLVDIEPPARVTPDHIPARDYLFVLDVSGSMSGFPLNTAQGLLKNLTKQLRPNDSFNVLLFAGSSQVLSPQPLQANQKNISDAIYFMNSSHNRGSGGTEMVSALRRAMEMPGSEQKSRSIVLITDGFINFEADAFELIRNNRGKSNVFCFGIGSSVNRHLVEGIATAGSGEAFVVTTPSQALETAYKFREYISSPILTNVKLESRGFQTSELQPKSLPDVFANRPITVSGKWQGEPKGQLVLSGITGGGEKYEKIIDVNTESNKGTHNPALRTLWAREKIRGLADYSKLSNDKETIQEITNLGLTYSILTDYTSFVAIDEVARDINSSPILVKQATLQPQGTSLVSGGSVPEPSVSILFIVSIFTLLLMRSRRCPV